MSRVLVISKTAAKDLNQIWDFIAKDSPDIADRVRDEIEEEMLKLCGVPGMGHRRDDVSDQSLRFWKVYSYLIAYRHTKHKLSVARVVSGHRNFKKLFRSR